MLALGLAIIVFFLMGCAEQRFAGEKLIERTKSIDAEGPFKVKMKNLHQDGWYRAAVFAGTLGVVSYLTPKFELLGILFFLAMIVLYVYLMHRWYDRGKTIKGGIAFLAIAALMAPVMEAAADQTVRGLKIEGLSRSLLFYTPVVFFGAVVGIMLFDVFDFQKLKFDLEAEAAKKAGDEAKKKEALARGTTMKWISRAVLAILILSIVVGGLDAAGFSLPSWFAGDKAAGAVEAKEPTDTAKAESVTSTAATAINEPWYHFYNTDLQDNGKPEDDFNFGVNPIEPKTKAETYDREFRYRMSLDPALGAADMAWWDSITGTRFLGEFYESCKGDWAKTMNRSKENWMKDQSKYYETLKAFNKTLDRATVRIEERNGGLDDQMYMNPDTPNGVPDIIVMETVDHKGTFLVYEITIKEQKFEIAYRIDCGYQPTNVGPVMNITPQPNPTKAPDPAPAPQQQPKQEEPQQPVQPVQPVKPVEPVQPVKPVEPVQPVKPVEPVQPVQPKKDPTQGTQGDPVAPGDNPGPGPNTNNPSNPNRSTEDNGGSSHGDMNDYNKAIEEIKKANEVTKEGGAPNTPSTTPTEVNQQLNKPAETPVKVDNNATTGTSTSAPIDTPTPVTKPAEIAQPDGGSTPITNEPGQAWGGPPD